MRRVDAATHYLCYRTWVDEETATRRRALCEYSPYLLAELHKLFRGQLTRYYSRKRTAPFQFDAHRLKACLDGSRLCQEAHDWNPRSFLEVFHAEAEAFVETDLARFYTLSKECIDDVFFEGELVKLNSDDVVLPSMKCSDLVECSCDNPCDCVSAFHSAHDFSDGRVIGHLSFIRSS